MAHLAVTNLEGLGRRESRRLDDYVSSLLDQIAEEFVPNKNPQSACEGAESIDDWARRLDRIANALPRCRTTSLDRRLDWLGDVVRLEPLDRIILKHLARARLFEPYEEFLHQLGEGPRTSGEVNIDSLAIVTSRSGIVLKRRLLGSSPLLASGLVQDCRGGDFSVTSFVTRIAEMRLSAPAALARAMVQTAAPSVLAWQDFDHLGNLGTLARDLVRGAARRRKGVNILLYGLPGTGKSEFAKVLAASCGLLAVPIGTSDDHGGEPDRGERMAHLAVCRSLLRRSDRHLLVVDEADDLMLANAGRHQPRSKLWLNQLVEATSVPTIWIINDPNILGSAVIRRMTLALEFRMPGPAARRKVVDRLARENRLRFEASDIEALSTLDAAPAVMANALAAARLTDRRPETATLAASSIRQLMRTDAPPALSAPMAFDPAFCTARTNIPALVDQLAGSPDRSWSLLAYGPPGTGKSALARHIAQRIGLAVLEKKASDLLNMYVGNTEKAIAEAFREAEASGAMLIMDEADSLLCDRARAERSWEVSMTNEVLTWMERCRVPFVATTNLKQTLDPATSRRFLFKIEFMPLEPAAARAIFRHCFGTEAPLALDKIHDLTPGDFALVARKARFLNGMNSERFVEMLKIEALDKPGARRGTMGFA